MGTNTYACGHYFRKSFTETKCYDALWWSVLLFFAEITMFFSKNALFFAEIFMFFAEKTQFSLFCGNKMVISGHKKQNLLILLHINYLQHIFNIYGKKACFLLRFLYLCTGNWKNSLLVPTVGHQWWPQNVKETAFWGIVIQGTFKHRQSVTNWFQVKST